MNFKLIQKPGMKLKNTFNSYKKTNIQDPFQSSGIYQIKCDNCPKSYIGQTARSIHIRTKEHLDSVNMGGGNYRKTWNEIREKAEEDESVGFLNHIGTKCHSTDWSQIIILEQASSNTLDLKETYHIAKHNLEEDLMNKKQIPLHNSKIFKLYQKLKDEKKGPIFTTNTYVVSTFYILPFVNLNFL
jgi:hypothetical protein